MKWARVKMAHWNTDLIKAFHWSAGRLRVWWLSEPDVDVYDDPDRERYEALCRILGVLPVEVDDSGQG